MVGVSETLLHEYPLPISRMYATVLATRDPVERHTRTRHLFEVFLRYAACVAISEYLARGQVDPLIHANLARLTRPSMGHWLNLFRQCTNRNREFGGSFAARTLSERSSERKDMVAAFHAIELHRGGDAARLPKRVSPLAFMDAMVQHRNRTEGHGAPAREQLEPLADALLRGVVDLILHFDVLARMPVAWLGEIKVERGSFRHHLTGLTGSNPLPLPDHLTDHDEALLQHDRTVFLCREDGTPALPLHPFVIYQDGSVFLFDRCDMNRSIHYICYDTGRTYSGDRLLEAFRSLVGDVDTSGEAGRDHEQAYLNALRLALLDGIIVDEEREVLDRTRRDLGLDEGRARILEDLVREQMQVDPSPTPPKVTLPKPTVRMKRLLFFPYASVRLGFWADLVSRIAAKAHRRGMVFSMVSPDPESDYEAAAMTALISDMDNIIGASEPDVVVMVPSPSRHFLDLFRRWYQHYDLPLVTVDTRFFDYEFFRENASRVPPVVQIDNELGGRQAADLLLQTDQIQQAERVALLVMPGLEGAAHSEARVRGFSERIREVHPDARIKVLAPGGFTKERSLRVFADFLEDANLRRYQGMFACNDEMALGCRRALLNEGVDQPFHIVGFNGTPEIKGHLRSGAQFLLGTIDQNLDQYTDQLFDVILAVVRGDATADEVLVPPVPWTP